MSVNAMCHGDFALTNERETIRIGLGCASIFESVQTRLAAASENVSFSQDSFPAGVNNNNNNK
jgi:hypothetical protein